MLTNLNDSVSGGRWRRGGGEQRTKDVDALERRREVHHAADAGGEDDAAEREEHDETQAVLQWHLQLEQELDRPEVDEQVA